MKKFLKYFSISLGVFFGLIYLLFLIVPPFVKLDSFKPEIQKIVKDSAKLNLDYSRIKIYTTPFLSAGVLIEDLEINLDDKSSVLKTPKAKLGVVLPSLLTLTVKTSKSYIENPQINLEILNDEQYKVLRVVEDIINENTAKTANVQPQSKFVEEIVKRIRIKVPSIKITDYEAKIVDLNSNHKLALKGEKLYIGYNGARNFIKLQTQAKLFSDENENINANINIISALPALQPKDKDVDPEEKMQIPFVNPVTIYQKYDLKTNINSTLRVRNSKKKGFFVYGFLNVDNLSLKLSDIRLPESYFHSKFNGKKIKYDSNIFAKDNEKISLNGFVKIGKRPRMLANIVSDEIHFDNLLALFKALLDSLNIKNDLALVDARGYLMANATIKTNFKKLKSQGSIIVKDGYFVNKKTNIGIKDLVANLLFDNNVLNIKDTSAIINGSKLAVNGLINNKSVADIKIDINNLSLPELYCAFAPKDLKRTFSLNSAKLSANVDIKGRLDKLNAQLKTSLDNLNISDVKKTMYVENKKVAIDFVANPKQINGQIKNSGFMFKIPSMKTIAKIDDLSINMDNENILINPFDFIYNDFSKINIKGDIKNYLKYPLISIFADGSIKTDGIKQTLGKEISYFLSSKGSIPLKIAINGDSKKQDIVAQIYADNNNFITPINLNVLLNKPSIIQADVKMQNGKIKIKNSGLYRKETLGFDDDLVLNMQGAKELLDFTSVIDGSHINLLRLTIPNELTANIDKFPKSNLKTKGKVILNGYFDDLSYGGDLKIYDIDIPEILFRLKNLDLDFISHYLNINAKDIDLNGSKINAGLKADLALNKTFNISNIDVKSDSIDVDKALEVLNKLMGYMPPAQNSTSVTANNSNVEIPLKADGKFDIKKIKTGAIKLFNTKGNIGIAKNNLLINKLSTKAFDGDIHGDITMNLLSSLLTIKLQGKNLDANQMLTDAANLKDTLSGTMKFKTDISLKGATYNEQVKSLKGSVWFEGIDGQYGPFAKLENFFLAENIRNNPIFANTIGAILTPLTTIDSTHYEKLAGKLDFNNGTVTLNPITSQGDILCVLIKGDMDLLKNELKTNVRVRLASTVSDMLGPLAMANPVNLIKNTPGLNVATAKMFSVFTQTVLESEYKEIPDFSSKHTDANATKFQIVLDGDVAKPLSLVKSFKWLALQEDIDKAQKFSENYVKQALIDELQAKYEADNKIKVGVEKILQMDTTAPEVKDVLLEEVLKAKEKTKQEIKQNAQTKVESAKQELEQKTQQAIDNKKQEVQQKMQAAVEEKRQEQQQKLIDVQNKLKNKLQEKIIIPTQVNDDILQ